MGDCSVCGREDAKGVQTLQVEGVIDTEACKRCRQRFNKDVF
jgi:hypothetical protein